MARKGEKTKKEWLAGEVAKAVGAGRAVAVLPRCGLMQEVYSSPML